MMAELTVYTTPSCPWCHKVKEFLSEKGVSYTEVDVSADYQAAQKMMDITGQRSVPVIAKGDQYVVGFDQNRIEGMIH